MTSDDYITELEDRADYVLGIGLDADHVPSHEPQVVAVVVEAGTGALLVIEAGIDDRLKPYAVARWFDSHGHPTTPTILDSGDSILLQPT